MLGMYDVKSFFFINNLHRAFARNSKFVGCDFTNAIVDRYELKIISLFLLAVKHIFDVKIPISCVCCFCRVSFDGSDLRKSVFNNAVLSGTTFTDANLQDTDFSNAYLGNSFSFSFFERMATIMYI